MLIEFGQCVSRPEFSLMQPIASPIAQVAIADRLVIGKGGQSIMILPYLAFPETPAESAIMLQDVARPSSPRAVEGSLRTDAARTLTLNGSVQVGSSEARALSLISRRPICRGSCQDPDPRYGALSLALISRNCENEMGLTMTTVALSR
jgi:hypothetical protein